MSQIGGGGGVQSFLDPPSKNLLGHPYEILNISSESSAQTKSIGTLFEQIGLREGSVDMSKSQRHTRLGAGRGVIQANGAAIHPKFTGLCQHEIVSEILKKWKAMWDCASQLWVPGRSLVHGRLYLSFCPITLLYFNFWS